MIPIDWNVEVRVEDARTGATRRVVRVHNDLTDVGRQTIRDLLNGTGLRADELRVGSGTTPTAASMEDLEATAASKALDRRIQNTFGYTYQALFDESEGNGVTWTEIGTFAAGTLVARAVISPGINKTGLIRVTVSHVFTVQKA